MVGPGGMSANEMQRPSWWGIRARTRRGLRRPLQRAAAVFSPQAPQVQDAAWY